MLAEFDRVEAEYGVERAEILRKACRTLVRNQFVYAGDRGAAVAYSALTDARFRRTVDDLFDGLGYRVIRSGEEQWVGIVTDADEAASAPKLRIDETLAVLVLASHWQDDADRGDLGERAVALTTANALHERYRDMTQSPGKATVSMVRFLEILKKLGARSIVRVGDLDREQQDREVEVRPMIKLLSGDAALKRIEDHVRQEEYARPRPAASAREDG